MRIELIAGAIFVFIVTLLFAVFGWNFYSPFITTITPLWLRYVGYGMYALVIIIIGGVLPVNMINEGVK